MTFCERMLTDAFLSAVSDELLGWNGLPHSNGAKRMSEEVWPRRSPGHEDKAWRTASGEPVSKSGAGALFSFDKADPRPGRSPWGVWKDVQQKIAGMSDAVQHADGSFKRDHAAEAARRTTAVQQADGSFKRDHAAEAARRTTTHAERETAYEIAHPDEETGQPKRRDSRGPGTWGSSRACCEMLGRKGRDPVTNEAIKSSTCLPHIEEIALGDPNGNEFTFGSASPALSTDANRRRQWIETAETASKRDGVAERWIAHFGPVIPLSSLPKRPQTTSLRAYVRAVSAGKLVMKVDGEAHREDDPNGHYKKGDVYDLCVTLCDPRTGSTVEVLFHECERYGKLDETRKAAAIAAIQSRPDALCCAWGHGPEWKWAIEPAGRRKVDGSDGIDLKEAVLQVMPSCIRRAASAVDECRWSMSQNLWVPVMGLRRMAYHQALPDCVTEGIVASALGRALARPVAEGGCM
jgi:hypothetical protein